jgi:hypothetical protein
VPVAYTCNPRYSGGRDQEDCGSKSAQANSLRDPILKNPFPRKKGCGMTQDGGPEFKPQYHTHTKRNSKDVSAGKDMEKGKPLHILGGNIN